MSIKRLDLSWSISRGRDTYGYNIARLDDNSIPKRYRAMGGGYDMVGTVFGDWLTDNYSTSLAQLFNTRETLDAGYLVPGYRKLTGLYGITMNPKGVVDCDGGCGLSSMIRIAEAIGLEVQQTNTRGRNPHCNGFIVSEVSA